MKIMKWTFDLLCDGKSLSYEKTVQYNFCFVNVKTTHFVKYKYRL